MKKEKLTRWLVNCDQKQSFIAFITTSRVVHYHHCIGTIRTQLMGVGTVQVTTNANYRTYTQNPGGFTVTVYSMKGECNV